MTKDHGAANVEALRKQGFFKERGKKETTPSLVTLVDQEAFCDEQTVPNIPLPKDTNTDSSYIREKRDPQAVSPNPLPTSNPFVPMSSHEKAQAQAHSSDGSSRITSSYLQKIDLNNVFALLQGREDTYSPLEEEFANSLRNSNPGCPNFTYVANHKETVYFFTLKRQQTGVMTSPLLGGMSSGVNIPTWVKASQSDRRMLESYLTTPISTHIRLLPQEEQLPTIDIFCNNPTREYVLQLGVDIQQEMLPSAKIEWSTQFLTYQSGGQSMLLQPTIEATLNQNYKLIWTSHLLK